MSFSNYATVLPSTDLSIPNRLHPSRFVVLSRESMWKKGIGELEPSVGASLGISSSTLLTDHSPDSFTAGAKPRSASCQLRLQTMRIHGVGLLATTSGTFAPFAPSVCDPIVSSCVVFVVAVLVLIACYRQSLSRGSRRAGQRVG